MQLIFFNKLVIDNSGRKRFDFFFEKEISVSLAYIFCAVVMYSFYLIN